VFLVNANIQDKLQLEKIIKLTFFQIATLDFNSFIAKLTASKQSFRCSDDITIATLISPTGQIPRICDIAIL